MADYATLLRDHVRLTCRSVDRIFLQAYVPRLQTVGRVCRYLRWRRGFVLPSSAAFGQIGRGYAGQLDRYADERGIPVVRFAKGDRKEEVAGPYLQAAAAEGGGGRVVLIGIAQEKALVWRSWKAKGQQRAAHPHMEWGRQMAFVNHFYFYLWDPEWGAAFWKTNAYAPYPIWIWLNGHSWAQRQCQKLGIAYRSLDNGFGSCADPKRLQRICDRLGPGAVKSFFWRWLRRLPSPFTREDLRAGYVHELAFRQFEVSDTRVSGRPAAGRAFFEGLIRDHLDLGRPSSVSLIFDKRTTARTPGTFRTKVVTRGVDPEVVCYYRASRIKQHFTEHRALRTEPVICATHDFGIGRRVNAQDWAALRAVGEKANQRLCDAQAADARPAPDAVTFAQVSLPSTVDGQHAPGLRFGDPRVMAVMAAIVGFTHLLAGFDNRALTGLVATLLDHPYTSRQATYDLRRLKRKGLILRLPGKHRYQLTPLGRQVAVLFTKAYGRVLAPGLATMDPRLPADLVRRSPLATAWRQLDHALDEFVHGGVTAA